MMQFFKGEENIHLILAFIFDPNMYNPTYLWAEKHPEIATTTPNTNKNFYKQGVSPPSDDPSKLNAMTMRSHKLTEVLSDSRNFRNIYFSNVEYVNIVFKQAYELFKREGRWGNLNHIGKLLNGILMYEQQACLFNIFSYNILFHMIDNIFNSFMFDIVAGIFSIS